MRGDCRNFHTIACSRPPLPRTRTFIIQIGLGGLKSARDDKINDLDAGLKASSTCNPSFSAAVKLCPFKTLPKETNDHSKGKSRVAAHGLSNLGVRDIE